MEIKRGDVVLLYTWEEMISRYGMTDHRIRPKNDSTSYPERMRRFFGAEITVNLLSPNEFGNTLIQGERTGDYVFSNPTFKLINGIPAEVYLKMSQLELELGNNLEISDLEFETIFT